MAQAGYYDEGGNWIEGDNELPAGRADDPYAPGGYTVPAGGAPGGGAPTAPTDQPTEPPPTTTPPPPAPPPTSTTGQFTGSYAAPDWMNLPPLPDIPGAPQPTLPTYTKPPEFAFKAPSPQDAMNDPGYQFRVQQGTDALQRWAAARGTLNDTGTANALTDYGQNAASQEYANVWNRDWNAQKGAYDTNYQTQFVDPYKFEYQAALDVNAPKIQGWQAGVDMNRLGYSTQAADVTAHNQANAASAWNNFMRSYDQWKFNTTNALGS